MKNDKRKLRAEQVELYLKQIARPAQKGQEPNDRQYDRSIERKLRQMSPLELNALLHAEDSDADGFDPKNEN